MGEEIVPAEDEAELPDQDTEPTEEDAPGRKARTVYLKVSALIEVEVGEPPYIDNMDLSERYHDKILGGITHGAKYQTGTVKGVRLDVTAEETVS